MSKRDIKTLTKAELDELNLQKSADELTAFINAAVCGQPTKIAANKRVQIPNVIVPSAPSNALAEAPREPEYTWKAEQTLFFENFGISQKPRMEGKKYVQKRNRPRLEP